MTMRLVPVVTALSLAAGLAALSAQTPFVTITVNRAVKYQTILGWGGTLSVNRNLNHMDQHEIDQLIDDLVENLGLTFLRVQDGILDEPFNDNADPNTIDWTRFHDAATIDRDVERGLRRFVSQVRARGVQPTLMLVKNWRGAIPWWMTDAEIAEHLFANALYYKQRHDIDINFISVTNNAERSLLAPSRYPAIARAFDDKVRAAGLPTRLTFDEGRNADATWSAVSALRDDTTFWPRVGLLSWHGPGSSDSVRNQLRDFAAARQIPTAMSGFPGATVDDLFSDLTQANASYWARNWIIESGPAAADNNATYFATGFDGVSFRHNQAYHRFRPIMRYVPVGAVRIDAVSSNPALRVAVFEKDNLGYVVALNTSSQALRATFQGMSSFGRNTTLNGASMADGMVVPLSPFPGPPVGLAAAPAGEVAFNLPLQESGPIAGSWDATPAGVTLPSTSVRLTARAVGLQRQSDFGDTAPPGYAWMQVNGPGSVTSLPGVSGAGTANLSDLTAAGTYEFQILMAQTLSQWGRVVARSLRVRVFNGNQAPVITEGYRYYRDEWLIAPEATATYGADFIAAGDIDGDPVTTSFSVVSQPSGANASFSGATVTGMTRAGEYVFRFTARDATHTVTRDFTRRVVSDEAPAPSNARRRPESAPSKGSAQPRSQTSGSPGPATVTTAPTVFARLPIAGRRTERPSRLTLLRVRELLQALEAGESRGLTTWSRLDLLDVDDDGQVDVIRVEFIDGVVWTIGYPASD
jgi:hypothetical protein